MRYKTECMIRLDDIAPDMDWQRFNQVKEVLEKYNIFPLIGVVPDNRDKNLHKEDSAGDFWNKVRQLQKEGWVIAQHGTYHCYETEDSGILGINPFSEFAGLSYEEQLQKLRVGKQILEENEIRTDIFMAPGHTYDKNTLKALKECGFRVITDGLFSKPYIEEGILFVPCRMRGFRTPSEIDTVCLHTNLMDKGDIAELDAFCKDNRDVIVPFEPIRYWNDAPNRSFYIRMVEKKVLTVRFFKDKMANSKRLAWYMEKTNHPSSKVKWLKRVVCFPMLICYRTKE